MAKKSRGFSELLRLEKMSQRRQTPFASLEQKLRKNSAFFDKLIVSPPGEAKMSEVLEEFVEPFYQQKSLTSDEGIFIDFIPGRKSSSSMSQQLRI
jgi:hypothetical protein